MLQSFYRQPPTYERLCAAIETLTSEYKNLKVFPIGKSVLGREIQALSIGNPMGATLFVGATHGLEWLTTLVLMRFCEDILAALRNGGTVSDIDVQKALRNRSLVIIPCLNPDGVEIALGGSRTAGDKADEIEAICHGNTSVWQANANGVDINHNFDAGWEILKKMEQESGIDAPAPTRYGGPHPHSEPEAVAVTTFCISCQTRTLYAMHSQGEEIYYRYGERTPERSQLMAQILASSSGYTLASPTGLASHGGLKDWFIDKLRRPAFTIEIGKGKNPLEIEQFDRIYQKIQEMLIIATLL